MPRYSEIRSQNKPYGSKYALNRAGGGKSAYASGGTSKAEFYLSNVHVSANFKESLDWFKKQQQVQLQSGKLYEDPFFPADNSTLSVESVKRRRSSSISWKRPKEITRNAQFLVEGASRFDVRQGELGDCWLLAALSSLSLYPNLFSYVVPEQSFSDSNYCGAFLFRFWQFGSWVDVVVDDRLPVDENGDLLYMHSTEGNEFWSALLEKAYAKLSNSYDSLKGGSSSEAMEDFTGGITEIFDLDEKVSPNLFTIMMNGMKKFSLMGCSIEATQTEIETKADKGLIKGHAYSVTGATKVRTRSAEVNLVRVRNPWGNECEWTGAWSDKSREWTSISTEERQNLGIVFDDDGEFWMSYDDFKHHFTKLEICHQGPESEDDASGGSQRFRQSKKKKRWEMCVENGEWLRNVTAGGCRNFLATFHMNPQFRVTVVDPDEDDDDNSGTLIVGLMQKERRQKRREGEDLLTIGYAIYLLKDNKFDDRVLDTMFFRTTASVAKSPNFINMREVCGRHKLKPGKYVIIPSTYNANEEAKFLLRIFSEKAYDSSQMDEKTEIVEPDWHRDLTPEQKRLEEQNTDKLKSAFQNIAGADGELDAEELSKVLNSAFKNEMGGTSGFSLETCRSLLAMMDADQSGKLGFDEFNTMWSNLRLWKTIFKKFDVDYSGTFNVGELRQALYHIGFKVSNRIFTAICTRYSNKNGDITFDDYILLVTRLRTVFITYKSQRKTSSNEAIFPQDEFMQCVLYM